MRIKKIVFILIVACLYGCKPDSLPEGQLRTFVLDEDNGLHKKITVNEVTMEVTYMPGDLLVAQEMEGRVELSRLDSLRKKYDQQLYFLLTLSKNGKEALHSLDPNDASYSDMLNTLSFQMGQYVYITTSASNEPVVAIDYVLNRSYGMASGTELLFAFPVNDNLSSEWIDINIEEFGLNLGKQSLRFSTDDIAESPRLQVE